MIILGIETSCDETAVAIIQETKQGDLEILSHCLYSQINIHKQYGGVVPEVAARSHVKLIDTLVMKALSDANINPERIDIFSSAVGPGLTGGLIVGTLAAKLMAGIYKKPFIAINHLQGHALMSMLEDEDDIKFPFLLLLISGGHTQFVAVLGVNKYEVIGETLDDAAGEAFDKSARLLGLPYPGGKEIQALAPKGDKHKYVLPMPLKGKKNCDFSFAGLKTAVRTLCMDLQKESELTLEQKQDISASLQYTISNIVLDRVKNALSIFTKKYGQPSSFVISGGVSANTEIRFSLSKYLESINIKFSAPAIDLCTDNAIMIAWAAYLKYKYLQEQTENLGEYGEINFPVNPRWRISDI